MTRSEAEKMDFRLRENDEKWRGKDKLNFDPNFGTALPKMEEGLYYCLWRHIIPL
jgi:hypothetical protein